MSEHPPCPKCNGVLETTAAEGLWCPNNCYASEFELWEELQLWEKPAGNDFSSRVESTENDIKEVFDRSLETMLRKNRERADCWRGIGLKGLFLEIRTMFFRARSLIWEQEPPKDPKKMEAWKAEVVNALEDLRNYTMLAELSINENNVYGEGDEQYCNFE